ncbi:DUF3021 domain-containing protein [Lactobacillus gasseri]|uniref:DUF3021 domain-containing protein n=1 Tax=Lactobacillus gasseri TaxID=1596 RepID=UPI003313B0E5
MKEFIRNFIKSSLQAAGFGPLILVIFYYIYSVTINFHTISVQDVNKNIVSSLLLAFIAGGINAIFKVERIPLGLATTIDAIVIYLDYLLFYVLNDWIKLQIIPFLVFTVIYIIGYLIIWLCIYHQVKNQVQKLNQKL